MIAKKIVFFYIVVVGLFFLIIFGALFIFDPLKIFHKPLFNKIYLHNNMRHQALGILNNWNYNSIILGTSMLENTSSKEASILLDGEFINVSLSGSDFFERNVILKYALKNRRIEKVLFSLDYSGLIDSRRGHKTYKSNTWSYLYDDNIFNDFKVYLNNRYLKCTYQFNKKECKGDLVDFDRPNAWYKNKNHLLKFGGLDNWFSIKNKSFLENILTSINNGKLPKDKDVKVKVNNSKVYLDKYIINNAKLYPNTKFILIIPPYSRIKNAINAQFNESRFKRIEESIRHLVFNSSKYKNIKVFAWGDKDFTNYTENYKDLVHYHHSINSKMLGWIKKEEGLLTEESVNGYIDRFKNKSLSFDLKKIESKIERYLNN